VEIWPAGPDGTVPLAASRDDQGLGFDIRPPGADEAVSLRYLGL